MGGETATMQPFDFIIVGGGTAGNTVAGRLAENPNLRILVIEAGVDNPQEIENITTPAKAFDLRGSQYDWGYKTTMIKRDDYERVEKPNTRGKVLGGSTCANYFTWIPGSKGTFDDWEEYGGKEWTWDNIVAYLRKCATYHDDPKLYPSELSKVGTGGPIQISHADLVPEMAPFREALSQAWTSKGHALSDDIYSGTMSGLTHCLDTVYKGTRQGSFLYVNGKPNITILASVQSKKLIIDPTTKVCTGVVVVNPATGEEITVSAKYEVIVSQGVFESPKLLMLSGVGPAAELKRHEIPVIVDSPHVGQNLLDHPIVPFVLRLKDGYGLDDHLLRAGQAHDGAVNAYRRDKSGPYSSALLEMVGFPRIDSRLNKYAAYTEAKKANGGLDPFGPGGQPHFELDFVPMFSSAFQWHYPIPPQGSSFTVIVDLLRPLSKGEVTLNSADPLQQANINLNFFGNDLDILAMREGVRWTYDVLTSGEGMRDIVTGDYPWEMPVQSDEAMNKVVLERSQTGFREFSFLSAARAPPVCGRWLTKHECVDPCGTTRLSKNIQQGVVDPQCRVHGIKSLRVVDASVIPVIPDCRPQNSVYMIAEKAADMIKAEYASLFQ
ncbi:Oxygen-dependent choline dehydrogenase [Hyphodiscus hymeniophilus]|uniref:Oxygen-dependent choline dehydrogenase n=1 Tax=Hyphodiscus hymeniophilus TaxID=353542 RepID=A0A9P6VD44_9HELO|nr:Oxygen-dependent choline dehydrogenase [Hyphodiscus hymeniophilus]